MGAFRFTRGRPSCFWGGRRRAARRLPFFACSCRQLAHHVSFFFMNRVLKLLLDGEKLSPAQMSEVLGIPQDEIDRELKDLEGMGILLGWRPVISPTADVENLVRAVIEVKISPERGGGFNRHAERISRFDEVESCYLMSGSYDLLVIARGQTLHQVAAFVSERLSTIEGVISTATHFLLRSYKEQGYLIEAPGKEKTRPDVTP